MSVLLFARAEKWKKWRYRNGRLENIVIVMIITYAALLLLMMHKQFDFCG